MIPGIAIVARCLPRIRRATAPTEPPRLTMDQAAALLARRPRVARRVFAVGCTSVALPGAVLLPLAAAPAPALLEPAIAPDAAALPFDLDAGPLLPPIWSHPDVPTGSAPWTQVPDAAVVVPEPAALAAFGLGVLVLIIIRALRR